MVTDSRHFRILAMVDNFTRERSLEYGSAANAIQTYQGTQSELFWARRSRVKVRSLSPVVSMIYADIWNRAPISLR